MAVSSNDSNIKNKNQNDLNQKRIGQEPNTNTRSHKPKYTTKTEYQQYLHKKKRNHILCRIAICTAVLSGLAFGGYKVTQKVYPFFRNNIMQGDRISETVKASDFLGKQPTRIVDANGKTISKLQSVDQQQNYLTLDQINPYLKKGLVAVEDKRFYKHHGVDMYGTIRAIVSSYQGHTQGGSTLTQQLVKNAVLQDSSQTKSRKIKEMVIAQNLEKKYSKKQILEFYLNNIEYNHSNLGIGAAARYYFGKDQSKLTPTQCALLIGMLNNPSLFDPITNPEYALARRNTVLHVWYVNKLIDKQQYEQYKRSKLDVHITPTKVNSTISHNYALSYALNQAIVNLMHAEGFKDQYWFNTKKEQNAYRARYNHAYELAREQILRGGFTIHTNINSKNQQKLQEVVDRVMGTDTSGKNPLQTSITVIDNSTGEVIGMQGGRGHHDKSLNRAYLGYHQPGSAAKMLVAYPEAFERGYAPQSKVLDAPIKNGPHNWYNGYKGYMSIRYAILDSVNTPAFRLASQVKPSTYTSKLAKMEFDNLSPQDANPIIAIGGFTNGVTTTQMASGYSALARQGKFISPTNVTKITQNGKVIYKNPQQEVPVFTPAASYEAIDCMKSVMHGQGSGKAAMLNNFPYVAGKTGTTDNNMDSYFVGMTPQYTIAVWVGHDKSGTELTQTQLGMPQAIFKQLGQYFAKNEVKKDFAKPANVTKSGDNLYVSKAKGSGNPDNAIVKLAKEQREKREKANQARRNKLSYRIKYHLTLRQEKEREAKVKSIISQIDIDQFTKLSQLGEYQTLITKAQGANAFVKRQEYYNKFNKQILQLQYALSQKQAMITATQEAQKQDELNQEKQKAVQKVQEENQVKIDKLQKQLKEQEKTVKDAYANGDPNKAEEKQKLMDIMDELRNYGVQVDDKTLTVLEN